MLAFQDDESGPSNMTILDTAINCLFFVDIILNFFTAYQDEEMNMIDDHRSIAKEYLKTWFVIDFISIIPFDLIMYYGSFNRVARLSRIGKIYKIIRMAKMVRLFKIAKVRDKLVKKLFRNFQDRAKL